MDRILVINTGSTSTKASVFEDETMVCTVNLQHSAEELAQYASPLQQKEMRSDAVREMISEKGLDLKDFSAIAARGGSFAVFESGAYEIDRNMLSVLRRSENTPGAAWCACLVAYDLAKEAGIRAYIYDAVSVDEMSDIAHLSGFPGIDRKAAAHTLNTKEVSRRVAREMGLDYKDVTFIVTHMGGGISTSVHHKGRMIDLVADDEGTFSPERAGRVPCMTLIDLCYSGRYSYGEMKKFMRGKGGLTGYLGTNSCIEVEKRISEGGETEKRVYEAMAYQIGKDIASMAAVVCFEVDRIILTGGIAQSKYLTDMIQDRVEKIAPIKIVPGSFEMEALAGGVRRAIHGEEEIKHL